MQDTQGKKFTRALQVLGATLLPRLGISRLQLFLWGARKQLLVVLWYLPALFVLAIGLCAVFVSLEAALLLFLAGCAGVAIGLWALARFVRRKLDALLARMPKVNGAVPRRFELHAMVLGVPERGAGQQEDHELTDEELARLEYAQLKAEQLREEQLEDLDDAQGSEEASAVKLVSKADRAESDRKDLGSEDSGREDSTKDVSGAADTSAAGTEIRDAAQRLDPQSGSSGSQGETHADSSKPISAAVKKSSVTSRPKPSKLAKEAVEDDELFDIEDESDSDGIEAEFEMFELSDSSRERSRKTLIH